MAVHKRTLIKQIAQEQGISENKTYHIIESFLDKICETIVNEKRLELRGFGVFHTSTKKGRTVHHPETNQPYQLPDTQAVAFRAAKQFKAQINPPQPTKGKKQNRKQNNCVSGPSKEPEAFAECQTDEERSEYMETHDVIASGEFENMGLAEPPRYAIWPVQKPQS